MHIYNCIHWLHHAVLEVRSATDMIEITVISQVDKDLEKLQLKLYSACMNYWDQLLYGMRKSVT